MSEEFFKALSMVETPVDNEPYYRLYYGEDGRAIAVSMVDMPGTYIDITKHEFETLRISQTRVVDGKIKLIDNELKNMLKLTPDDDGEFITMPNDMMIVSTTGDRYSIKKYE